MLRHAFLGSRPRTALTVTASAAATLVGYSYYSDSQNPSTPPLHSALQLDVSLACPLVSRETLTADTARFRFALPSAEHSSGLTTASHVLAVDNAMVSRAYTPVSAPETKGHFDLVVKRYPGGEFSTAFHNLRPGDAMDFRGPVVTLDFERPNVVRHLCLVAGGTGITPMYQIVNKVLATAGDATEVRLLYANKSPGDVLLKKELDALAARHPRRFRVHYVVEEGGPPATQPRRSWRSYLVAAAPPSRNGDDGHDDDGAAARNNNTTSAGRIDAALVRGFLVPSAERDAAVLVCGPPGMLRFLCGDEGDRGRAGAGARAPAGGLLGALGYGRRVVRFTDRGA